MKMKDTTKPQQEPTHTESIEGDKESFESPDSSNIVRASYDRKSRLLLITYKGKNGSPDRIYKYKDFPYEIWLAFKVSSSKGRFANEEIVHSYRGELRNEHC